MPNGLENIHRITDQVIAADELCWKPVINMTAVDGEAFQVRLFPGSQNLDVNPPAIDKLWQDLNLARLILIAQLTTEERKRDQLYHAVYDTDRLIYLDTENPAARTQGELDLEPHDPEFAQPYAEELNRSLAKLMESELYKYYEQHVRANPLAEKQSRIVAAEKELAKYFDVIVITAFLVYSSVGMSDLQRAPEVLAGLLLIHLLLYMAASMILKPKSEVNISKSEQLINAVIPLEYLKIHTIPVFLGRKRLAQHPKQFFRARNTSQ